MRPMVAHQCAQLADAEIGFLVQVNEKPSGHIDPCSTYFAQQWWRHVHKACQLPVILDTEEPLQRVEQVPGL